MHSREHGRQPESIHQIRGGVGFAHSHVGHRGAQICGRVEQVHVMLGDGHPGGYKKLAAHPERGVLQGNEGCHRSAADLPSHT